LKVTPVEVSKAWNKMAIAKRFCKFKEIVKAFICMAFDEPG